MVRDRKIKSKKVVLASDHAGFKLKEEIKKFLIKKRKKVLDLGTKNTNSVDYPDYAHLLSKKMTRDKNNSVFWYADLEQECQWQLTSIKILELHCATILNQQN